MIRVMIVDDERPALQVVEHFLKKYPEIEILGSYIDPFIALEEIGRQKPDVVFLDIEMPQMRGLDTATMILEASPDTDIVFVTAHHQYAIEGFELDALDYLLKPVSTERFDKTIQRLLKKERKSINGGTQNSSNNFIISDLGAFQAGWKGGEPIRWRTEKTKELFAFLVHHAGRFVSKDVILDAVYMGMDLEKATHQLHNGIYYIRKNLEDAGVDRRHIAIEGNYTLKLNGVVVESQLFLDRASQGLLQSNSQSNVQSNLHCIAQSNLQSIAQSNLQSIAQRGGDSGDATLLKRAVALYRGDYLESMDWDWAKEEQERLSRLYENLVLKLAEVLIVEGGYNEAEELLLKLYKRNPYLEEVTQQLLKSYKISGKTWRARKHTREYESMLAKELGEEVAGAGHGNKMKVKEI